MRWVLDITCGVARRLLGLSTLSAAADRRLAAGKDCLPKVCTFAFDPETSIRVTFKVAIDVTKAAFEQFEEGVPKGGVHANHFAGMIRTDAMASERLFEQGLFICATTIEITRRCLARRIGPPLAS